MCQYSVKGGWITTDSDGKVYSIYQPTDSSDDTSDATTSDTTTTADDADDEEDASTGSSNSSTPGDSFAGSFMSNSATDAIISTSAHSSNPDTQPHESGHGMFKYWPEHKPRWPTGFP